MLSLFSCPACKLRASTIENFPLCAACKTALKITTHDQNTKQLHCYSMHPRCYEVLKTWKKTRGLLFDRVVLRGIQEISATLPRITAIIPIPQSRKRQWDLGNSPALGICEVLSKKLNAPIIECLAIGQNVKLVLRQAEKNYLQRLSSPPQFELNSKAYDLNPGAKILVVDDFSTTGSTLRQAQSLIEGLNRHLDIYTFALGIRPNSVARKFTEHA